jgi:hypothetical protein
MVAIHPQPWPAPAGVHWWGQNRDHVRLAGENEAAGAADAELCHTKAVWVEQVRYLGFALQSSNSFILSRLGFKIHRPTASRANACGFLLTPNIENASHKQLAALVHFEVTSTSLICDTCGCFIKPNCV